MKIIYFTDSHIKGKNPVNRLDNYNTSCLAKMNEITEIAKEEKCDAIICGGDIFDTPTVSNTVIDDVVDIIEDAKIDFYIVPGNHDMTSHNWEVSKSSALAHIFRRSDTIKILDVIKSKDCFIKGYKYHHTIEEELKENGLKHEQSDRFTIAVPHAFISIKSFFKEVSHICAKDLDTNYDLVLCSHFHMTFDETINDTRFLNTNSLGRTSISEKHNPTIAIVDTNTKEIKTIELKSAKPVSEIFDLTKYEQLKGKQKDIKEFLDSLKDVKFQSMSVAEQITKIGKEQNADKKVTEYLLTKIDEVSNE